MTGLDYFILWCFVTIWLVAVCVTAIVLKAIDKNVVDMPRNERDDGYYT